MSSPIASALPPSFYPLGDLPGGDIYSFGLGLSGDGSVAVGVTYSSSGPEAFRWTASGGMVGLGDLPGGAFNSGAFGVSPDGNVIVGVASGPEERSFRWTAGEGMQSVAPSGSAWGASGDGAVIVGRSNFEAYRWTQADGAVGLGDLPGGEFNSLAFDVSADGKTVVGRGRSASGFEAFRWTAETGMVGLMPGMGSLAMDVSADGSLVLGSSAQHGAFVWDQEHGARSIQQMLGFDLSDWDGIAPQGISDDGSTIIGVGVRNSGVNEAWIAVLPEPSTLALVAVGGLFATRRRRGRQS